jgi:hypothetical protein
VCVVPIDGLRWTLSVRGVRRQWGHGSLALVVVKGSPQGDALEGLETERAVGREKG